MFDPTQHLMKLKGKDYLQVAWRLVWFRDPDDGCPSYGITTEMLEHGEGWAVFKATITDSNGVVVSTGHGSESQKDFGDYLEKAETKAVGRALAMLGFGTQFVGDELDEGERIVDSPVDRKGGFVSKATPYTCSECGNQIMMSTKKDGSIWKASEIAEYSKKRYGKPMCVDCMKRTEYGGEK